MRSRSRRFACCRIPPCLTPRLAPIAAPWWWWLAVAVILIGRPSRSPPPSAPPPPAASLLEECRLSPLGLRNDLAAQFLELLKTSAFLEALPAFLPPDQASQQRLPDLLETLRAITALAEP
jgi:hypothetical protein